MKYKLNGQWVDVTIKPLDSLPIGTIVQFAGETIPTGWLVCDGSSLSTTTYPDLYTIIGTKYGGSGSSFNLPNFKGRVPVGQDTSQTEFDTLGETGGEKTHTLTVNEMPSHSHKDGTDGGSGINASSGSTSAIVYFNSALGRGTTETGGDQPHNNLQPYLVVNYIIKAFTTTPTLNVSTVQNTRTSSNVDTYSCNYLNGTVLYEDASGANNNVTLSDNINNYVYIEIYSRWYDSYSIPAVKLNRSNITSGKFNVSWSDVDNNGVIIFAKIWNISNNSITKNMFYYYNPKTGETSNWDVCYITKVVGYK